MEDTGQTDRLTTALFTYKPMSLKRMILLLRTLVPRTAPLCCIFSNYKQCMQYQKEFLQRMHHHGKYSHKNDSISGLQIADVLKLVINQVGTFTHVNM